jgi:hydroxypyruvate isomerase
MKRREFISAASVSAATLAVFPEIVSAQEPDKSFSKNAPFKLKYAPHFGMFTQHAGEDLMDQLHFMYDQGFRAFEDNDMMGRTKDVQGKIATTMGHLGMTMGVFVAYAEFSEQSFVISSNAVKEMLIKKMEDAVDVARRVNARWCTVVPGAFATNMEWDYQTANVVENLKWCAEICEPSGLVMVLEPLNAWRDHPGLFLTAIPQAYQICRAVNSPSCKILDDLYHQQITEGNLIPNIDRAWSEIAYIQVGDNPGRKEPTTGEINYRNVFKHLHEKGYSGIIGMEHGLSKEGKEGEQALLSAYRYCDGF